MLKLLLFVWIVCIIFNLYIFYKYKDDFMDYLTSDDKFVDTYPDLDNLEIYVDLTFLLLSLLGPILILFFKYDK